LMKFFPKLNYFGFAKDDPIDSFFGRGSTAAEFCYVACGRAEGVVMVEQNPWDVAAGQLIASEAGVKLVNFKGEKTSIYEGDYVIANPELLTKIMEVIKE